MKPDEAIDLLSEAHREPIPEAHFAAVRARVLSQIAAERVVSQRPISWYGFAVAAAAALLLAFWPKQPVPRRVISETRAPIVKPFADARGSVDHEREGAMLGVRRRARRRPRVAGVIGPPNPTPLVVKILTNDSDVVIYWISVGTGE